MDTRDIRGAMLLASLMIFSGIAQGAIEDLRVTELDPATGEVEVTNLSTDPFTATGDILYCHKGVYGTLIPDTTSFTAGESQTFTVPGFDASEGDVWVYRPGTINFADPGQIISGLQYGSNNGSAGWTRVGVAVSAGIWSSITDFVPLPNASETSQLNGLGFSASEWVSRTTTANMFFGTGTEITDPMSNITQGTVSIDIQTIASGLTAPQGLAPLRDGTNRALVFEQTGEVYLMENDALSGSTVLNTSSIMVPIGAFGPGTYDERGLLGIAVHPDFGSGTLNFYTYTNEPATGTPDFTVTTALPGGEVMNNQAVIREWTVTSADPFTVNTGSSRELLRVDQPQFNHNGGTIRFGPDGYLYIVLGDGGAADDQGNGHDPDGNGQNPDNIYGTVLRIDVDGNNSANGEYGIPGDNPFVGSSGIDEIYAYGLRNPFSFSFDSSTGDLYVADVGQNDIEEINVVESGGNYGWRLKEGTFFFDANGGSNGFVTTVPTESLPADLKDPIAEYDHDDGRAVIGGFVYRGTAVPDLAGLYLTGDFGTGGPTSGKIFYLDPAQSTPQIFEIQIGSPAQPFGYALKGIGENEDGEIYLLASQSTTPSGSTGVVLKVVPVTSSVETWMLM